MRSSGVERPACPSEHRSLLVWIDADTEKGLAPSGYVTLLHNAGDVIGVDAPGAGHSALHDMMVTGEYYESLPPSVRDHLVCRIVDQLVPITQKHDIEVLVLGEEQ